MSAVLITRRLQRTNSRSTWLTHFRHFLQVKIGLLLSLSNKTTSAEAAYIIRSKVGWKDDTFWATTGLFPQEFIMTFASTMKITRINLASYNIQRLRIEKSTSPEPNNFEPISDRELDRTDGQLQIEEIDMRPNTEAVHLRFTIESGHDHFVCIHKLNIDGNAIHGA